MSLQNGNPGYGVKSLVVSKTVCCSKPEGREKILEKLPLVFIDYYNLVKVSLTKKVVNCSRYVSRSGASFSGCLKYDSGEVIETKGIYYTPNEPLFKFESRAKVSRNVNEMHGIIKGMLNDMKKYVDVSGKLLIVYDNYSVKVYPEFKKGKMIMFPEVAHQGDMRVMLIPKPDVPLELKIVSEMSSGYHKVVFEKEVSLIEPVSFGGFADIVHNPHDHEVKVKIISPSPEWGKDEEFILEPDTYYLVTHPKRFHVYD